MAFIACYVKDLPKQKGGLSLSEANSKFDLEIIVGSFNFKDIFLGTEPFLPIPLVNGLTFQEFKFKFSQKAPFWKLRDDGLRIEAVNTVGEMMVGWSFPWWDYNYLYCSKGRVFLEALSLDLKLFSYSRDFLRRSCVNKQLQQLSV